MGWISKTFKKITKAIGGAAQDIFDFHKKVFKSTFLEPVKKAWKNKVFRYVAIAAAVVAGGVMLAGAMAANAGVAATGAAAGGAGGAATTTAALGATGATTAVTGATAGSALGGAVTGVGGLFPGMSVGAGSTLAAVAPAATTAGGLTLGQAAALQLGGAALSQGAQALEAKRAEDKLRQERNRETIAGVRYKGGKAEDAYQVDNPIAGARPQNPTLPPPTPAPPAGLLSQSITQNERVPYYLRG